MEDELETVGMERSCPENRALQKEVVMRCMWGETWAELWLTPRAPTWAAGRMMVPLSESEHMEKSRWRAGGQEDEFSPSGDVPLAMERERREQGFSRATRVWRNLFGEQEKAQWRNTECCKAQALG